jgi:NitT/TauT family transport system substrate-binding protein
MAHLVLVAYLRKGGADLSKVNIVEMPFPLVSAALARGTIAAGIIAEPSLAAALDDVRILARPMDLVGNSMMIAGWFTAKDWLQKNPGLAHTFAQTIYQTARWANANHDKSAAILRKYAQIDDSTVRKMVRVIYGENLALDMIDPTLELAAREGFTSRRVHASEMVANV